MTDSADSNDRSASHGSARRPSGRRPLIALTLVAGLIGGYYAVMAVIRSHVDGLIENAVDNPMPAFSAVDRDGRTWTAAELAGKPVVLHFFRSRCHSCDVEAPDIRQVESELPDDVVLLHVMTDRVMKFDEELTQQTIAHKQFTRPILMADAAFMDAFHTVRWSQVTPITYVADGKGVVRYALRGRQTRDVVMQAVAAVR